MRLKFLDAMNKKFSMREVKIFRYVRSKIFGTIYKKF
jgi:hypothetical protein